MTSSTIRTHTYAITMYATSQSTPHDHRTCISESERLKPPAPQHRTQPESHTSHTTLAVSTAQCKLTSVPSLVSSAGKTPQVRKHKHITTLARYALQVPRPVKVSTWTVGSAQRRRHLHRSEVSKSTSMQLRETSDHSVTLLDVANGCLEGSVRCQTVGGRKYHCGRVGVYYSVERGPTGVAKRTSEHMRAAELGVRRD